MEKVWNGAVLFLKILLLAVFLPALFCVLFIGNRMEYYADSKLTVLLPNALLALMACAGVLICIFLFWKCRGELGKRANLIADAVLALLFIMLYFINVRTAREIAFYLPWDIGTIRQFAYQVADGNMLGYQYYLSMYSNNIFITYLLGKILEKAAEFGSYPYVTDFIWIQVNCALLSAGGFFSCLTVKKLTKKLMPVAAAFLLYLALVGISPWKIAPYTDTYGLVFPILCICFYIYYRSTEKTGLKYLFLALAYLSGAAGGAVKPSAYLLLIAVLITELLLCLCTRGGSGQAGAPRPPLPVPEKRAAWKFFALQALLFLLLLSGAKAYKTRIIEETGLDFNQEIEMSWQHYFMMGLNEETTGGYSVGDAGLVGEYQTSGSERKAAELDIAFSRLRERGLAGSLSFWLKKMTMVLNDGTFGWRWEGGVAEYYPETMAGNTPLTEYLRNIFWNNGSNMGRYNTLCQLAWFFCMLGIPGICLFPKEEKKYALLLLSFLGIFFYQLLFEARARYLFVFLPVLITVSICGIQCYAARLEEFLAKKGLRKKEFGDGRQQEDAPAGIY